MINRKVRDWSVQPATISLVTEHVGRSLFITKEWTPYSADYDRVCVSYLNSIDKDGRLVKNSIEDYECGGYEIDATDSVYSDYWQNQYNKSLSAEKSNAELAVQDVAVKGRIVKVVGGRTSKGTVGKVVVVMEGNYGMGYRSVVKTKLGIATSPVMVDKVMPNGKVFQNHRDMVWVWADNCVVENPDPITNDDVEKKVAIAYADRKTQELRVLTIQKNKQQVAA